MPKIQTEMYNVKQERSEGKPKKPKQKKMFNKRHTSTRNNGKTDLPESKT